MSRDMMGAFELYQPDTVENAVELLGRFGEDGWALAGGNDSLDWFKDRHKRPTAVIDMTSADYSEAIEKHLIQCLARECSYSGRLAIITPSATIKAGRKSPYSSQKMLATTLLNTNDAATMEGDNF